MKGETYFKNYPSWIVFFSNFVSVLIYLIGAGIIYQIGAVWLVIYLFFILFLEFKLISRHCIDCYYYGKTCAFGKGRISSLFFKRGNAKRFCKMQMTTKDMLPDFMVSAVPFILGIVLLISKFNWILFSLVILLFILTFFGNAMVRSKLACKYCKQRKLGCPAQKLFERKK